MAYSVSTGAITCAPASPTHGVPFMLTLTLTGHGTVDDDTITGIEVCTESGPQTVWGDPTQGTTMAGANEPTGYGTTLVHHDGTATFTVWGICSAAGTVVVSMIANGYRASIGAGGASAQVHVVPTHASLTIQ